MTDDGEKLTFRQAVNDEAYTALKKEFQDFLIGCKNQGGDTDHDADRLKTLIGEMSNQTVPWFWVRTVAVTPNGEIEIFPLHFACKYGLLRIVKVLLSEFSKETDGSDNQMLSFVNQKDKNWAYLTPLQIACSFQTNEDIIRLLLQHRADPLRDDFGPFPSCLHFACEFMNSVALDVLLECKCVPVDYRGEDGESYPTPLSMAISKSWIPGIRKLLDHSANLDLVRDSVKKGASPQVQEFLSKKKAKTKEKDVTAGLFIDGVSLVPPMGVSNTLASLIAQLDDEDTGAFDEDEDRDPRKRALSDKRVCAKCKLPIQRILRASKTS